MMTREDLLRAFGWYDPLKPKVLPQDSIATLKILDQYEKDFIEEKLRPLWGLADEQAKDEGLWFRAETAPEAYLQQELRVLHRWIEDMK